MIVAKSLVRLWLCLIMLVYSGVLPAQVVINEYSCSNRNSVPDNYGKYEDWFELYNTGNSAVDLGGYYLSDRASKPTKWQIPSGTMIAANGHLIFWTSGRDAVVSGNYHTNFKLTQTKQKPEYIVLSNSVGNIIDQVQLMPTLNAHSRGRTTNGASSWGIFTAPTPNASNNTAQPYTRYADKPAMSLAAGFYSGTQTVTLTTTELNAQIRYTTDGTEPKATSNLYTAPVAIAATTVLKASTYSSDSTVHPGFVEYNTYFINVSHSLVVVSVAADDLLNLANGNDLLVPIGTIEYFNKDKVRTTHGYGEFNKHGQDSWKYDQRSIDFIMRDEFGYNYALQEKIFALTERDKFQRIILRDSGDDNYPAANLSANQGSAHMRDSYTQNLAKMGGLHLDVRTAERGVVYINGQYWGVYELREKADDPDYTDYYYGQGKYDLQYLMIWGNRWAEYGGNQALSDWDNLYNYIMNNDMSVPANYQYVTSQYDVTSLIDYVVLNSYSVCSDWLNYNTGWWRGLNSGGGHQRWGYILWDEDATYGHYINYTGIPDVSANADPCNPESLDIFSDPEGHIKVLNRLRNNPDFDQYYISRFIDLSNTTFSCANMLSVLDSFEATIEPEMQQHAGRWFGTYTQWKSNVQQLRNFISQRCVAISDGLKQCYSLTGPYDLTLSVLPANTGKIQLNSLVMEQFPWTGSYFSGVAIKMKALAADSNYVFDRWEVKKHSVSPAATKDSVSLNITSEDTVIAHFRLKGTTVEELASPTPSVAVYPSVISREAAVEYELPAPAPVSLKLYSVLGNEVVELVNSGNKNSTQGKYKIMFSPRQYHLPAGMYILSFRAGGYRKSMKVLHTPE